MSPPRVGTPCACDACPAMQGDPVPWTGDGYCAFCGTVCAPLMVQDGRATRLVATREARDQAHQGAPPSQPFGNPAGKPLARQVVEVAISGVPDPVTRQRAEAVLRVADQAVPLIAPKLNKLWRAARAALGNSKPKRRH